MTMKFVQIQEIENAAINFPVLSSSGVIKWDIDKTLKSINCDWLLEFIENRVIKLSSESMLLIPTELVCVLGDGSCEIVHKCDIDAIYMSNPDKNRLNKYKYNPIEAYDFKIEEINKTDWIVFNDDKLEFIVKDHNIRDYYHRLYTDEERVALGSHLHNEDLERLCNDLGIDINNQILKDFDQKLFDKINDYEDEIISARCPY